MSGLDEQQRERYKRQLGLPGLGEEGQRLLGEARVLVVGAGGLGSPVIFYLAAAGVGTLGIADGDDVDLSNLQRQILHDTLDIGSPKTQSAARRANELNPEVKIEQIPRRLNTGNIEEILKRFDVVADCTDNFHTRYLINDACVLAGRPMVHGSVFEMEGQASTFVPGRGPCYRCLFPQMPPDGLYAGAPDVLGAVPGLIGAVQAAEVMKLILGIGETLTGRLLLYDGLKMRFREMNVARNAECEICGDSPTITRLDPDSPFYK